MIMITFKTLKLTCPRPVIILSLIFISNALLFWIYYYTLNSRPFSKLLEEISNKTVYSRFIFRKFLRKSFEKTCLEVYNNHIFVLPLLTYCSCNVHDFARPKIGPSDLFFSSKTTPLAQTMALWVEEFSSWGYKIRNIFA